MDNITTHLRAKDELVYFYYELLQNIKINKKDILKNSKRREKSTYYITEIFFENKHNNDRKLLCLYTYLSSDNNRTNRTILYKFGIEWFDKEIFLIESYDFKDFINKILNSLKLFNKIISTNIINLYNKFKNNDIQIPETYTEIVVEPNTTHVCKHCRNPGNTGIDEEDGENFYTLNKADYCYSCYAYVKFTKTYDFCEFCNEKNKFNLYKLKCCNKTMHQRCFDCFLNKKYHETCIFCKQDNFEVESCYNTLYDRVLGTYI